MPFASETFYSRGRPPTNVEDNDEFSPAGNTTDGILASRNPYFSASSSFTDFNPQQVDRPSSSALYPVHSNQSTVSLCSSASATPIPSRAPSPSPSCNHDNDECPSSCSSDSDDSELDSSLLRDRHRRSFSLTETPRWWTNGPVRRKRRQRGVYRTSKWVFRQFIFPFIPKTPLTIIFTLLLLTAFAISLANLIIYLCNPDKEPLPWRGYCTIPNFSTEPPPTNLGPYASFPLHPGPSANFTPMDFPPNDLDTMSPAGIFVGVFSMDTGFERRMLIRSTYASHPKSRNGAGEGDDGIGTSRTIVRFVMGKPRKEWERRIELEMETYNDIVILDIRENMNDGKTYSFFKWAASGAWVPPLYLDHFERVPQNLSYANITSPAPRLAHHDPIFAHQDVLSGSPKPWVRPDFIIKADDDSFVMLAELEARLRTELHGGPLPRHYHKTPELIAPPASPNQSTTYHPPNTDPLIYWGYLVKNRFMGGELYALSHSLVDWIANDPGVRENVRGAEDQVTARWMRWHPKHEDVRWVRERCWIYDHPKAGTVYSRGFLFPSEQKRVQKEVLLDLERWNSASLTARAQADPDTNWYLVYGPDGEIPPPWVKSSVTTFQKRYTPPVSGLSLSHSIEALTEGSEMSKLPKRNTTLMDNAWNSREGRSKRYEGKRVGGTIIVHSIKKHMWFLEAATALLEGDDLTEYERAQAIERTGSSAMHLDKKASIPHTSVFSRKGVRPSLPQ